jgi:hypothetical protein
MDKLGGIAAVAARLAEVGEGGRSALPAATGADLRRQVIDRHAVALVCKGNSEVHYDPKDADEGFCRRYRGRGPGWETAKRDGASEAGCGSSLQPGVRAQVQIGGRSGLGFASAGRENTHGYLRGWGVAIKIEVLRNEGIRDGIE